jgi:zinc transport system permease protein
MNVCRLPVRPPRAELGPDGKIQIGVFAPNVSHKNVDTQLIGALMVIPVITAIQWRGGFGQTILTAIVISLFSVISGLFISYYLGLSSGGTIVIIALVIFLLTCFFTKNR